MMSCVRAVTKASGGKKRMFLDLEIGNLEYRDILFVAAETGYAGCYLKQSRHGLSRLAEGSSEIG
jgi:hypothetical protein